MDKISVLFGGIAGDGIRGLGAAFARIMSRYGWYVFDYDDYQSIIRGGHNFSIVTARRDRRVWSHWDTVEAIVALNRETIDLHLDRLVEGGIIIYDSDAAKLGGEELKFNSLGIPLRTIIRRRNLDMVMRNSIAMGALLEALGIPLQYGLDYYRKAFPKYPVNLELLREGYELAEGELGRVFSVERGPHPPRPVITGNEAAALGLLRAGLKVYLAYPMTPSTSILHTMAALQEKFGILAYQPENEISVINMALGAAYAGARTAVATSGGGFALMVEALSLAAQSETPILIMELQRPAPSTGVPTYTAQGDLMFVLSAGHGEFPRIVIAPGDVDEAFYYAGEGLNLAWRWQVPVIFLGDKHLAESPMTAEFNEEELEFEDGKVARSVEELKELIGDGGEYGRYLFTDDGVSPIAIPGIPGVVVKSNSYEHDERGLTTEDPEEITRMYDKRLRKLPFIIDDLKRRDTVKVHGDPDADVLIVSWGSTKGAILEAMRLLDRPIKFLQFTYLEPFPSWAAEEHLRGAGTIVDIENNATAPLTKLIKLNLGVDTGKKVLKYDGRPFSPVKLAEDLERVVGWA